MRTVVLPLSNHGQRTEDLLGRSHHPWSKEGPQTVDMRCLIRPESQRCQWIVPVEVLHGFFSLMTQRLKVCQFHWLSFDAKGYSNYYNYNSCGAHHKYRPHFHPIPNRKGNFLCQKIANSWRLHLLGFIDDYHIVDRMDSGLGWEITCTLLHV